MIGKFSIREILEAFLEAGIWSSFPGSSRTIREESHVCYENMPIFLALKIEKFQLKKIDIFLIFAQNIDCGYKLEPQ